MPSCNIYHTSQLQNESTAWTLLDQLQGTGGIISYTNAWPDPVGFYFLDVSVAPGSQYRSFQQENKATERIRAGLYRLAQNQNAPEHTTRNRL